MGNNSHRSDPGNSNKLNQLMTSEKNSKNSSADGLKNPGKCFGKARRHRFCILHGVFDDLKQARFNAIDHVAATIAETIPKMSVDSRERLSTALMRAADRQNER